MKKRTTQDNMTLLTKTSNVNDAPPLPSPPLPSSSTQQDSEDDGENVSKSPLPSLLDDNNNNNSNNPFDDDQLAQEEEEESDVPTSSESDSNRKTVRRIQADQLKKEHENLIKDDEGEEGEEGDNGEDSKSNLMDELIGDLDSDKKKQQEMSQTTSSTSDLWDD